MRNKPALTSRTVIIVVLFVAMLAFAFVNAGIPRFVSKALSSTQPYASHSTEIVSQINSDSSLLVTEQRSFTFTKKTTCVRWVHEGLLGDSEITMRGLRASIVDENGNATESVELPAVPFKAEWRDTDGADGIGPGYPSYAIDDMYSTVYTFFEAENESVVFTVDFEITNGLKVWRDATELEWTFLSDQWAMDSENLTVSLQLPIPANTTAQPGGNVNAWSHGPRNGQVEIDESGLITYETERATVGQWASLHVIFPTSWITNLPDTKEARQYINELHRSSIINNETYYWVDSATAAKTRGSQFDILVIIPCLIVLVFAVVAFVRFGRDTKPKDTTPREARAIVSELHPAIIGRVARWNRKDERDLAASIVRLWRTGAVAVEKVEDGERTTYRIDKIDTEAEDAMDTATLEALFNGLAGGSSSVTTNDIAAIARDQKETYCETLATWNHKVDHLVEELALFDKKSFSWQAILFVVAALLFVVGLVAKLATGSNVLFGASLPVAFLTALLANYMPRRTQQGQDLAHCIDVALADLPRLAEEGSPELALIALQFDDRWNVAKTAEKQDPESATVFTTLAKALSPDSK